jgi:chromosome segregation ATPase
MARGGVNKVVVQNARNAIVARGEKPSIDAVRIELGNTGSKTTIHRYLKEIEDAERERHADRASLSEQLASLISQLADQINEEAHAAVAQDREQLGRERLDYQVQARQAESRIQLLESQCAQLTEQLQIAHQALQQEQQQRQAIEIENARLLQANRDQDACLQDRAGQIRSLEDKHQHARDALEHFRQASKEQREQELRRHESQVQQLQLEQRQLQQTLMIKQNELTQLNRDNERLLTEARQLHRDHHAQQTLLDQKAQVMDALQSQLSAAEAVQRTLQQRNQDLQSKLGSLSKIKVNQHPRRQPRVAKREAEAVDKSVP